MADGLRPSFIHYLIPLVWFHVDYWLQNHITKATRPPCQMAFPLQQQSISSDLIVPDRKNHYSWIGTNSFLFQRAHAPFQVTHSFLWFTRTIQSLLVLMNTQSFGILLESHPRINPLIPPTTLIRNRIPARCNIQSHFSRSPCINRKHLSP